MVRSHDLDDVVAVVHLRDLPGQHVTVAEAARQAVYDALVAYRLVAGGVAVVFVDLLN